ncbi:MAG: hypothetical protein HY825_01890 [Acidobacteria bacterium]|nr:hypothetical protein [Acidobacteriota bacterium]
MKITLAYGTGTAGRDQPGEQPELAWEGDDGQEDEEIPGSLCRDLVPWLDVGVWHLADDIVSALPGAPPASKQDITVRVLVRSAEAVTPQQVLIPLLAAVHGILAAVTATAVGLGGDRRLFVRVE